MVKFSNKKLPFNISISDGFLQLIGTSFTKNVLTVDSVSFGKIPLDVFQNGEIIHKKSFVEMLTVLIKNSQPTKISSNFCYVSLPDELIFLKFLSLPKVSEKELDPTIKFKIKNFLPHKLEEMYLDWQLLKGSNQHLEVSVAGVTRRIIDSFLDALRLVDIFPLGFEPESVSLARVVSLYTPETALVIFYKEQSVSFAFVEKAGVLFVTTLSLSAGKDNDTEVLEELKKASKYFKANFGEIKVLQKVYLAGLVERELVIARGVKENFQLEAEKLPTPAVIPQIILPNRLKRLIPLLGLALGEKTADLKEKRILLIPDKVKGEREAYKFQQRVSSVLKSTSMVLFVFVSFFLFVFLSIFFQYEQVKSSLAGWQVTVFTPRQTNLEKDAIALNEKIISLDQVLKKEKVITPIMQEFIKKLPAGIRVTSFNLDAAAKTIIIKGTASSRKEILVLEKSLESMGQVSIPLSSFEDSDNAKFTATLKLE